MYQLPMLIGSVTPFLSFSVIKKGRASNKEVSCLDYVSSFSMPTPGDSIHAIRVKALKLVKIESKTLEENQWTKKNVLSKWGQHLVFSYVDAYDRSWVVYQDQSRLSNDDRNVVAFNENLSERDLSSLRTISNESAIMHAESALKRCARSAVFHTYEINDPAFDKFTQLGLHQSWNDIQRSIESVLRAGGWRIKTKSGPDLHPAVAGISVINKWDFN